jgi:phosphoglycerate kinase
MTWKTLDDIDLAGRVVLTRVDINVPVKDGRVTDATRIERIVPTVTDILAKGGKPVLLAHFDRPKGKAVPEMSLRVTLPALEQRSAGRCASPPTASGQEAQSAVGALGEGEVLLLENTRFHPGEEKNDPDFAAALAALGDVYCNDAFSAAHRAHASTEALARLLPACAGRQMQAELQALEKALAKPERPVVAIVGGAKVSTKIDLLQNLTARVDALVIGGAMANTFLAASARRSAPRSSSATCSTPRGDRGRRPGARLHPGAARGRGGRPRLRGGAPHRSSRRPTPARRQHDDPRRRPGEREADRGLLDGAKTLVWNGPLGAFEIPPFDKRRWRRRGMRRSSRRGPAALGGRRRRHGGRAERAPGWRTTSPMSRPPAAPSSNGSRGGPCQASPRSRVRAIDP